MGNIFQAVEKAESPQRADVDAEVMGKMPRITIFLIKLYV